MRLLRWEDLPNSLDDGVNDFGARHRFKPHPPKDLADFWPQECVDEYVDVCGWLTRHGGEEGEKWQDHPAYFIILIHDDDLAFEFKMRWC